jgi:transposase-like protein
MILRMTTRPAVQAPPFCPNPACHYHRHDRRLWRFRRSGTYTRKQPPHVVQCYQCVNCRRQFGEQTFRTTYWLKRADLLRPVFMRLVACSGFRQIAREFGVSPTTIATASARLGRHGLLFHQLHRPKRSIREPLALDSFESFEWSQYYPTSYHVAAGKESHFFYGFTASELRRKGSMTDRQRAERSQLEARFGRPDPRAIEKDVAILLRILLPKPQAVVLHTDEHRDYPRAVRRVAHLKILHETISSRAARTTRNPLFAINLLDLLLRHSGANHKRETIAYSKRRASAFERMGIFIVWRNWMKWFSERKPGWTPAMLLRLTRRRLGVADVLKRRLFPTRIGLPNPWDDYYWRRVPTRVLSRCTMHRKRFAF